MKSATPNWTKWPMCTRPTWDQIGIKFQSLKRNSKQDYVTIYDIYDIYVLNSNEGQHIPIFSCSEEYLFHCHSVLNILWQTGWARARGGVSGGVGRRAFTAGGGRLRSGESEESHNRLVAVPATISILQAASLMEYGYPPGGAHENSIFSRRAKVDVLLQHQCCTSSCVSAGLNNLMFLSRLPEFHTIMETKSVSHLISHAIPSLPYLCISWVPSSPLPPFPYSFQFYLSPCVPGGAGLTQCVPSIHSPPHCDAAVVLLLNILTILLWPRLSILYFCTLRLYALRRGSGSLERLHTCIVSGVL